MTIETMLTFAEGYKNGVAMRALPEDKREILKLPRQYISDVLYTMIGEDFEKWANKIIEQRNADVVADKDLSIMMDPEVARIFKASSSVAGK